MPHHPCQNTYPLLREGYRITLAVHKVTFYKQDPTTPFLIATKSNKSSAYSEQGEIILGTDSFHF